MRSQISWVAYFHLYGPPPPPLNPLLWRTRNLWAIITTNHSSIHHWLDSQSIKCIPSQGTIISKLIIVTTEQHSTSLHLVC